MSLPIVLNHFYLTIDPQMYADIERSAFLKEQFAPFERRTTVRTDRTYTGIYFYGNHTYFEFFEAKTKPGEKLGDSAIAFGVDYPDSLNKLQTQLKAERPTLITRQFNDRQVPWFYLLSIPGFLAQSGISSWIMEYHPQFLAEWNPSAGNNSGISRAEILRRYTKVLQGTPQTPLLEDVTSITIALDKAAMDTMKSSCEKLGLQLQIQSGVTLFKGTDFSLQLIPATQSTRGIQQVEFRVRTIPAKNLEYRFGPHSVLRFEKDNRAIWTF